MGDCSSKPINRPKEGDERPVHAPPPPAPDAPIAGASPVPSVVAATTASRASLEPRHDNPPRAADSPPNRAEDPPQPKVFGWGAAGDGLGLSSEEEEDPTPQARPSETVMVESMELSGASTLDSPLGTAGGRCAAGPPRHCVRASRTGWFNSFARCVVSASHLVLT
eukprot:COSAG05_NODE_1552_length_4577_cov_17.715275_3_plen_166_part_00